MITPPSKYDYIDDGIIIAIATGDLIPPTQLTTSPVSNLTVTPNVSWNGVTNITKLQVTWTSNAIQYSDSYTLTWSKDGIGINTITNLTQPAYDIENPTPGNYTIAVVAHNGISNVASPATKITYAYKVGANPSSLLPPINPRVTGTSALISNEAILSASWGYNTGNDTVVDKLLDYVIKLYEEVPGTVVAQYSVTPNADKSGTLSINYSTLFDKFSYFPRKISWKVFSRDTAGLLSEPLEFLTENPVPSAPSFSLTALEKNVKVDIVAPVDADGVGYNIYTSLTSGGTRTLVYSGASRSILIPQTEVPAILKYYTIDAFDLLGQTGINTSAEQSAIALATTAKASDITNTPAGTISATDMQSALNELDSEKEAVANKVTSFSSPTDMQYPSAKLVNDALAAKLDTSAYHLYYKGKYTTLVDLQTAYPTATIGDYAQVDAGSGSNVVNYNWDSNEGWVIGSPGSGADNTDMLPEGSTNLYWTSSRSINALLTGLSTVAGIVTSTDSILAAIGKLIGNITALFNGVGSGGSISGWDDEIADIVVGGSGAADPIYSVFFGNLRGYELSATQMKEVFNCIHIRHNYKPSGQVFIHVHWSTAGTNTGVCRWGFEYSVAKGHNQQNFPATTTVYVEQAAHGTAYRHMVAETASSIDVTNIEPDSLILLRVFRDATHANDTLTDTAFLLKVDIHYEIDRIATKNKTPNFYT